MHQLVIYGVISVLMLSFTQSAAVGEKKYPIRLQPEIDAFVGKIDEYLRKDRLFNFQLKCLLDEGPCDIIGKYLYPRMAAALLGDCLMCTPLQASALDGLFGRLQKERPAAYRRIFVKFIEKAGITVDENKKAEIVANEKIEEATRNTNKDTAQLESTTTKVTITNATTN